MSPALFLLPCPLTVLQMISWSGVTGDQGVLVALDPLLVLIPWAALHHVAPIELPQRSEAVPGADWTFLPRCCIPVEQLSGQSQPQAVFLHTAQAHTGEIPVQYMGLNHLSHSPLLRALQQLLNITDLGNHSQWGEILPALAFSTSLLKTRGIRLIMNLFLSRKEGDQNTPPVILRPNRPSYAKNQECDIPLQPGGTFC